MLRQQRQHPPDPTPNHPLLLTQHPPPNGHRSRPDFQKISQVLPEKKEPKHVAMWCARVGDGISRHWNQPLEKKSGTEGRQVKDSDAFNERATSSSPNCQDERIMVWLPVPLHQCFFLRKNNMNLGCTPVELQCTLETDCRHGPYSFFSPIKSERVRVQENADG
ncbi:hypothetical protein C8J57DRAFT_1220073 [Mycena rebaudengoi]|nr:hypothetical protein C8J57DRAFT_1220073 [Mycena rebaudengoi]